MTMKAEEGQHRAVATGVPEGEFETRSLKSQGVKARSSQRARNVVKINHVHGRR